jgi:hypothetical protein
MSRSIGWHIGSRAGGRLCCYVDRACRRVSGSMARRHRCAGGRAGIDNSGSVRGCAGGGFSVRPGGGWRIGGCAAGRMSAGRCGRLSVRSGGGWRIGGCYRGAGRRAGVDNSGGIRGRPRRCICVGRSRCVGGWDGRMGGRHVSGCLGVRRYRRIGGRDRRAGPVRAVVGATTLAGRKETVAVADAAVEALYVRSIVRVGLPGA